nr:hypothetical protein [uncultured Solibaculum sp.]
MQDTIRRILEMDEQARQLTEDASSMRAQAEISIEDRKRILKEEYLNRAKEKICQIEKKEREFADEEWKATLQKYHLIQQRLNDTCKRNFDAWVEQIVSQTIAQ